MATLAQKLAHLAAELALFPDPQEQLAFLVDRAKRVPPLAAAERSEANRVHGCVSVVWLTGEMRCGCCHFRADADSPLVRGLVIFLAEFFSGASPAEVAASELDPLETLGLTRQLSPTRRHGLAAARTHLLELARTEARKLTPPDLLLDPPGAK